MAEEEDHDLSEIHVEPPSNEYSKASEVGFMCEDPSVWDAYKMWFTWLGEAKVIFK